MLAVRTAVKSSLQAADKTSCFVRSVQQAGFRFRGARNVRGVL
jgi:hypothetical protein